MTPSTPELVGFVEKIDELSLLSKRLKRERERSNQKSTLLALLEGSFIPVEEEIVHTFGLTPVVISGVAELYDEPVNVVVSDEDVMRHVVLMMRRGGVRWCTIRTPPPQMLNLPLTWLPGLT
ncbi:hypothetical protein GW17_00009125 [Ensete ventricosum]|nr:hypothetical protein GW17_00009125 [Ensete ventricosum]